MISNQLEAEEFVTNLLCSTFFRPEIQLTPDPLHSGQHVNTSGTSRHTPQLDGTSCNGSNYKICLVLIQPSGHGLSTCFFDDEF